MVNRNKVQQGRYKFGLIFKNTAGSFSKQYKNYFSIYLTPLVKDSKLTQIKPSTKTIRQYNWNATKSEENSEEHTIS